MQRLLMGPGIAAGALLLGVVVMNFVSNPWADRRAQLDADLELAGQDSGKTADEMGGVDSVELQKAVAARAGLWDALTPAPAPRAAAPDLSKLVAGIEVLPGGIGGSNPKVRLRTPENPRGQFYKAGDAVRNGVVVQEITDDTIVLGVPYQGKVLTHRMGRR